MNNTPSHTDVEIVLQQDDGSCILTITYCDRKRQRHSCKDYVRGLSIITGMGGGEYKDRMLPR